MAGHIRVQHDKSQYSIVVIMIIIKRVIIIHWHLYKTAHYKMVLDLRWFEGGTQVLYPNKMDRLYWKITIPGHFSIYFVCFVWIHVVFS